MMDEPEEESLRRKLDDLEREKQQIISLVSHDIKAPLNRMFALVQLMQMDSDNLTEEQHGFLDKMHLVVADGLGLIRNLVDYRNLEYRKTELLIEKVNLPQLIQLVVKNFQTVASKKKITIEIDLQPDVFIHSDHHSIIRIIESLLSNAVKFSREEKTIRIRSGEREGVVFFAVQDGGPGFTSDDLKKMYHKFQKLTARSTGGESATGLGLYISKLMADRIGAEIVCVTEEGIGSTFTVTIPKGVFPEESKG
jgi:signal transduction histidine kinase